MCPYRNVMATPANKVLSNNWCRISSPLKGFKIKLISWTIYNTKFNHNFSIIIIIVIVLLISVTIGAGRT